jgi:hypothetical protein
MKWLVEEKLLRSDEIEIADDGKKFSLFRTVLKSFNVKYEYNNVVMRQNRTLMH